MTKDIRISDHQQWQKNHWRSIETAYNNSPYFVFYKDYLVPFYVKKFIFLVDLNLELLRVLLKILKTERPIRLSNNFEKNPATLTDLRDFFDLKNNEDQSLLPNYTQVFEPRHGFIPGLSILDVLFNLGPETLDYMKRLSHTKIIRN